MLPMTPTCIDKSKATLFGLHYIPWVNLGFSPACGQRCEEWSWLLIKSGFNIQVEISPKHFCSQPCSNLSDVSQISEVSFILDATLSFYSINKAATKLNIFRKVFFFFKFPMTFSTFTNLNLSKFVYMVTQRMEIYHFVFWLVFLFCLLKILYMFE